LHPEAERANPTDAIGQDGVRVVGEDLDAGTPDRDDPYDRVMVGELVALRYHRGGHVEALV
jgi:hypothetical protein